MGFGVRCLATAGAIAPLPARRPVLPRLEAPNAERSTLNGGEAAAPPTPKREQAPALQSGGKPPHSKAGASSRTPKRWLATALHIP